MAETGPFKALDTVVERYARLEAGVRKAMAVLCQNHCSRCAAVCCRPVYCDESRESAFLRLVRRRFSPDALYDAQRGWLGPEGCRITAGRPPVCYEFVCGDILADMPDADVRRALDRLAMLLTEVGRRAAAGGGHLVTVVDDSRLLGIRSKRLIARIQTCERSLGEICRLLGVDERLP